MSFDRPGGLWLLALAIPIAAFHFYRGKIRRLAVPTLLFWEQVLVDEERKSALKKLRHYISLILNLLALTVLTSAVSEPRVRGVTPDPRRVAIVVDTTPSMLAAGRLDRAKEEAVRWLDSCDEAALYDGEGVRVPLTPELDRVKRSLMSLRIRPGRPAEIAEALRRARPDLHVVLLDDGGSPLPNRAWTGGVCVFGPGDRFPSLRLRARRFDQPSGPHRVVVRWNGEALDRLEVPDEAEVPLNPAKYPGRRLELGGVVEVAFEEPDAHPLDDTACFVVPPAVPVPVVVFHPGRPNPELIAALRARTPDVPTVAIEKFAEARRAIVEGTAVIFDRCAPPEPLAAGAVLLFRSGGGADRPAITDWDRSHPLLEGVDLSELAVRRSAALAGLALVHSTAGPIVTVERRGGFAKVEFGFSLEESDFALRPGFPVFLWNWLEWVRRGATRSLAPQADFARPLPLEAPLWIRDGTLLVRSARGETTARAGEPIVPEWPGPYEISAGGRSEYVAVNAFDEAESDLTRTAPAPERAPPPRPWYRRIPYALVAAAVVLALLTLEWLCYHRGWI